MSPGFPPWIALTLPAGFRFGKSAAGVNALIILLQSKRPLRGANGLMVELVGIEPTTSALQRRRSPS
jgi:hypothetical protein